MKNYHALLALLLALLGACFSVSSPKTEEESGKPNERVLARENGHDEQADVMADTQDTDPSPPASFANGVHIVRQEAHIDGFTTGVVSHSGELLLTWGPNGVLKIWSSDTGRILTAVRLHSGRITALSLSPDDRVLASTASDGSMLLYSLPERRVVLRYTCQEVKGKPAAVGGVTFSPNGELLALGCGGSVELLSIPSGERLSTLPAGKWLVGGVRFSPDGEILAAVDNNGHVSLWDVSTRSLLREMQLFLSGGISIGFTKAAQLVTFDEDPQSEVKIWATSGDDKPVTHAMPGLTARCYDADASHFVLCGKSPGVVLVGELSNPGAMREVAVGDRNITRTVFVVGHSRVLVATETGDVSLVDIETRETSWSVPSPTFAPKKILVFDQRGVSVIGDSRGQLSTWRLDKVSLQKQNHAHDQGVHFLKKAVTVPVYVSASLTEIKVWSLDEDEPLRVLTGWEEILGIDLGSDGKHLLVGGLLTGNTQLSLKSYNLETGECEKSWPATWPLQAQLIAYGPQVDKIYRVIYEDRSQPTFSLMELDLETGKRLRKLALPEEREPEQMEISSDGKSIVIGTFPAGFITVDVDSFQLAWVVEDSGAISYGIDEAVGLWALEAENELVLRDLPTGEVKRRVGLEQPFQGGVLVNSRWLAALGTDEVTFVPLDDGEPTVHLTSFGDTWLANDDEGHFATSPQDGPYLLAFEDELYEPSTFSYTENRTENLLHWDSPLVAP